MGTIRRRKSSRGRTSHQWREGLHFEPLESRVLLSATPTDDSFRLALYADSTEVEIPAEIGVRADDGTESLFTVDDSGEVYLAQDAPKLGDFFDIWRDNAGEAGNNPDAHLSENQLLDHTADGTKTVQMFVNGQISTEFEDYVVQDDDQIVLIYGENPVLSLNTNYGPIVIELFEGATPITVNNFLNYVNDGDYLDSFFHRSVEDFVIQGGGYTTDSTTFTDTDQFTDVPTDAPIQNEPGISNLRGTFAMAKLGGDPNSATSQFFVNLTNDHATSGGSLDSQNGGFTVFGQVLDMTTVDTIADLEIKSASSIDTTISSSDASLYSSLPLGTGNTLVVVQSIAGQGELSGIRYLDWNRNGEYDGDEQVLAGETVYLDANENGILDAGERTTITAEDGSYHFQVEAGHYIVRPEVSQGRPHKGPFSPESYAIDVEIGREISNLNFGQIDDTDPTLAALPSELNMRAGAPIHIALDGYDQDGDALYYSVSSTNPNIVASIPKQDSSSSNRSMRITVQGYGDMVFELFEGRAPNTTARIIEIVESGWYESREFHRIIDGFMIQGGSRDGLGINGTGTQIDDEYHADLQFTTPGLLAMAKSGDDTGDSQFFITDIPSGGFPLPRWLDFNYTIFGKLTAGEDVRNALSAVATDLADHPIGPPIVIESVEIFHDDQDAVMMIAAPDGTFDSGEVTVTVHDGFGGTASQTIQVNVLPDSEDNKPFLGPINPVRLSVDQPYSFQLDATDVEGDTVYYQAQLLTETDNVTVDVTENGLVTITPTNGFVGNVDIVFCVGPTSDSITPDSLGQYDETLVDKQVVSFEIASATEEIDFLLLPQNDLTAGDQTYTFQTAHEGFLTIEALFADDGDSVSLTLYDSDGNELTNSAGTTSGERLDWQTAAGVSYSLHVAGESSDVDLRIANLVQHEDTTVTVYGTAEVDDFLFSAENSRNVTINGVRYAFDDEEVSVVNFDADKTDDDQGSDIVRVEGSTLAETLTTTFEGTESVPTMVFETNTGAEQPFTVTATNFEQLLAWSRSGEADTAVFEDSPGRDKGKALPGENASLIRSKNGYGEFYRRAKLFEEVTFVGANSPTEDTIVLFDTPGDDRFEANAQTGETQLTTSSDVVCATSGFAELVVRSVHDEGSDTATLVDSGGNDKFVGRPGKSRLYNLVEGNQLDIVVRDFYTTVVDFANGGYDKARLADSPQADQFSGTPEKSEFWGLGFKHVVHHAEEVTVTSQYLGDGDMANLSDTALNDLLRYEYDEETGGSVQLWTPDELGQMLYELIGFESVDANGTTGENTAETNGVDFVHLYGSWTEAD